MRRALPLAAVLALALVGCGGDDSDDNGDSGSSQASKPTLTVSAASSMTEALTACSPDFEDATVRLQFAGSDELAAQIEQGVKPDVYAAANTKLPDALHEKGLLSTPVKFATNEFVLAVPKDSTIVVIDNGTISEIGAHEDLMKKLGTYRRLYDLQFTDAEVPKAAAES